MRSARLVRDGVGNAVGHMAPSRSGAGSEMRHRAQPLPPLAGVSSAVTASVPLRDCFVAEAVARESAPTMGKVRSCRATAGWARRSRLARQFSPRLSLARSGGEQPPRGADRIAHVVKAVEHRDEVVALAGMRGGRGDPIPISTSIPRPSFAVSHGCRRRLASCSCSRARATPRALPCLPARHRQSACRPGGRRPPGGGGVRPRHARPR